MPTQAAAARLLLISLLVCASGCALFNPVKDPATGQILQPPIMPPGSVAIEVFSVCLPPDSAQAASRIWADVDEQDFPVDLRRDLAKNGFRAGLIAGQVPPPLLKLLDLKGKPGGSDMQHVNIADLATPARVTAQQMEVRAGQRYEITASSIIDKMPILANEGGELHGVTYEQAQGIFCLHVSPLVDGRVELELVPEVHHGQARQHFVADQAFFRVETGRPKRAFDDLKLTARLAPGGMLLLGSQPDRAGSLGHYFFLDTAGGDDKCEQKLILIRLCQTQHNDLVSPGPLPIPLQ